jgi:hypothetical protein
MRCTCRLKCSFKVMQMLKLLWIELCLFYYRAALHQMGAAHPDAPVVVLRLRTLQDKKNAWGLV